MGKGVAMTDLQTESFKRARPFLSCLLHPWALPGSQTQQILQGSPELHRLPRISGGGGILSSLPFPSRTLFLRPQL